MFKPSQVHLDSLLYMIIYQLYYFSCMAPLCSNTIELLIRIIGKDKFNTGTELIHEGLQSHILNKQVNNINCFDVYTLFCIDVTFLVSLF